MPIKELERNQPIYASLERRIGEKVRSGELKPGQCIGTTAQMAKDWGVSSSTARYLLQSLTAKGVLVRKPGVGTFISDNVDVDNTVEANGNHNSTHISLLLPDISISEYARLARGIQNAAAEHDLDLVVTSTDDKIEKYDDVIKRHIESNILGFVLVPPRHCPLSMDTLFRIHESKTFGVSCYRPVGYSGWPVLMTNRLVEIKKGVTHLFEIGRKKIAYLSGNASDASGHFSDKSSFIEGLLDHDLSIHKELIHALSIHDLNDPLEPIHKTLARVEEKLTPWLQEHKDMDAICCGDDYIASVAVRVLRELGRKVPEDVAVVGQGGFAEFVGCAPGELTTIDGCFYELGTESCKLLLEKRGGKEFPPDHVVKIVGELMVGKSTVAE